MFDVMPWNVAPALGCEDVAASAAWWRDVLGFHLDPVNGLFAPEPGEPATYAILDRHGAGVHLQWRVERVERDPMHYDAYFYVDGSIDELFAAFTAQGVTVIFPPCDEEYAMRDFGIETPDGHRLNFGASR